MPHNTCLNSLRRTHSIRFMFFINWNGTVTPLFIIKICIESITKWVITIIYIMTSHCRIGRLGYMSSVESLQVMKEASSHFPLQCSQCGTGSLLFDVVHQIKSGKWPTKWNILRNFISVTMETNTETSKNLALIIHLWLRRHYPLHVKMLLKQAEVGNLFNIMEVANQSQSSDKTMADCCGIQVFKISLSI